MKRFLSAVLAVMMIISCTVIVSADDKPVEITKQPTVVDPSVELSSTDAVEAYQWYKLGDYVQSDVTAENASAADFSNLTDELAESGIGITLDVSNAVSSYDSESGWTPASVTMSYPEASISYTMYFFFSAYFKADTEITVDFSTEFDPMSFGLFGVEEDIQCELNQNDDGSFSGTVLASGNYYLAITSMNEIDITAKANGCVAPFEPIEDETESKLSKLEHGNVYRCAIALTDDSVIYSTAFAATYEIVSQPTSADPTFEVTFEESASFQWFSVTQSSAYIDDNATDINYGTYNAATHEWTGEAGDPYDYAGYQEYELSLFAIELKAGQVVTVTLSNPDAISPEDSEIGFAGNYNSIRAPYDENGVATVTVTEDDNYLVYQYCQYPETTTFTFEYIDYEYEELEGETEKTLSEYELGVMYAAAAAFENGVVLQSDVFEMKYAFIKQPTADDLSVEVNFADEVNAYQWFKVFLSESVVTDENAFSAAWDDEIGAEGSYYDSENGYWVPSLYSVYEDSEGYEYFEYDILEIELEEGQIISFTPSADDEATEIFATKKNIDSQDEFIAINENWVYKNGVYSFTAPYDDSFYFYTDTYVEDITFTALLYGNKEYVLIEGETAKALQAAELGNRYACSVTYKDCTVIDSDVVFYGPEYMLGDVNADGAIDQYDYILVIRHYFGTRYLTDTEMLPADVNCDGVVDQYDYILIRRHYFGTYVIG